MKPFYLLTLILVFGNCVTTSYTPEGIVEKVRIDAHVVKQNKVKYRVNMNFEKSSDSVFNTYQINKASFDKIFIQDRSSPIQLKFNFSRSSTNKFFWSICMLPLFIPCRMNESDKYFIIYGNENQLAEKKIEYNKHIYSLTIFSVFFVGSDLLNLNKEHEVFDENLLYSLREEIAKIAPLAEPDSDTPQTADLPTTFNDIVVLKNGDILEGVHTKVTPTTLEVTESNGKKTIYKKSQVLSVKRK